MQPLQICIGPIIRIGRESWCLLYAEFFITSFTPSFTKHATMSVVSEGSGFLSGGIHDSSSDLTFGPPVMALQDRPGLLPVLNRLLCTKSVRPYLSISSCFMEQARKSATSSVFTPSTLTLDSMISSLASSAATSISMFG